MRLLAAVFALIVALAACVGPRRAPPENAGLGAITAITMEKTPCNGTCPAYTVRLTADGRARYAGRDYAPLQGRFSGTFDFAPLAAWIATQHPETLPDKYPTAGIDAPAVNLQVDYGARRVRFTGVGEGAASLRLEGILLALDGATSRIRWRRDDQATAFLGTFRGGLTLYVGQDSVGTFNAFSMSTRCPRPGFRVKIERGVMRLRCESRTSVLRIAGDDLVASGDAVPPGRYSRVNPYAVFSYHLWNRHSRPAE